MNDFNQNCLILSVKAMLDRAISGEFTEELYDESLLSSIETSFSHYLSASSASVGNVRAEKEKIKELIADISHQTKTPISNLLLYIQLLSEQNLPKECLPLISALTIQAEKLNFLTASLVKVSRLETGVFSLSPVPSALQPLLKNALEQITPYASKKGLSLMAESTNLTACFDPKWTAEALYNLLDNAVKYTSQGGSIVVKATGYDLFTRIDILDTGIGIKEDEQEKIFRRFYRGNDVRNTEGAGIGLYLSRQIIMEEGGYIRGVKRPGGGSVFSVFLPAKP